MFPIRNLRRLLATPVVRLRPAFTALALAAVTLAAASAAAQSVTVSFEHAEYSVPEGYFPDGSISYSQVNIFLSAAPNTFPDGTFALDYAGRLDIPLTREMIGGARHGVDFYGASASVRFEPDETTAFLRIFPQSDDDDEEGEGVKIGFGTAPKGVLIGTPSTATVMFEEPGMPAVRMSLSPQTIAENEGVSTVSAWLGYPIDHDVTVTVRVETGDSSSADDFRLSENRTLTITAGSKGSTGTVTVTAVDNTVDGPDLKPVWVHGSVTGLPGTTDASSRALYIEDDDELGVTLVLSPSSISENGGESTVTATLNGTASDDLTVTVAAAPVAPAVNNDFTLNGTTLTIEAGETSSTGAVTITAHDDNAYGPKSVTVTGTVTGSTDVAPPAAQTLTITDDETAPTVTLALDPTSISENGGESSTVTATLSGATLEPVTLTVAAEADSPAVAEDFELTGTTLTFDAGDTQSKGTVTIAAVNNDADAPDRTVTVSAAVTEGPAGLSAPAAQTLTITDDEEAPTVTLKLNPASISEIDGESTVTATLSGPSSEAVTVSVTARPDSPAVSGDFELTGSTLTIEAGVTASTGEVKVTAKDNDLDAPDKRVVIGGTVTGGNGAAAPAPLTLTITDDEDTPTLTLALSPASISENGGETTVTASLNARSSADVIVTVSATAVEPAVANDFRLSANRELTIRAGLLASTGTVTISAENNDVDAPAKRIEVTASATGGNGVAAPAAQTLTITDDDDLPTVTLSLDPTSIGENGGRSTVTASLDRPSSEPVTVEVSVAPVSPAVDADFELTGTTLTIGPGDTASTGTVTIAAVNNEVDAPAKTFEVRGAAQGGRGVSDPAGQTLAITDDEDTPEVTLKLGQVSISEDGGKTAVTASLDGLSSADVVVTVSATAVEPATANDFRLSANRELTITAGQLESTGTVTVSAVNNTMDGPNKTIEVAATVSGESGVSDPAAQILTIIDDEGAPTVTLELGSASISENSGETTVTATLSGTSSEAVTVTVSVMAAAPVVAGDFKLTGTTLTIGAGATGSTGEVKVTARNNDVDAPDKTVEVKGTVTGGNGATAPAPLVLTITDDEDTPTLTLALDPTSIPENRGEAAVTASLDGLSSDDVVVTVSAAAVEPAVANDFRLSANRELTITAGQSESAGTVTISAKDNDVDAPARTVEVTASAEGGNGVAAPAAQTLTITDDDGTPALTLKLDPTSIGENGGRSTVTASLDRPSSESVTVEVSVAPVSPAVEADFELTGTTLTIGPGETESTGTVTIAARNNEIDAPGKTFEVRGSVQGGGVSDPAMQVLAIDDDEETPRVVLDLSPSTIEEDGGTSEVRASLTVPSSEPVKVNVDASSTTPSSVRFSRTGPAGAEPAIGSRTVSDLGHGFVLGENRELTIGVGETESEDVVTITALNDTVDGPNRTVEVTGTVTGGNGALPPMPKMLKIMDDDGAPAVTLVLTPARIGEKGGVSTVTAVLSPTSSEPVTVTVSASAESPADGGDFVLSTNRELTIAGGETDSTRTVTITAVDDDEDGPDKQVTVRGTVTGPAGLAAPSAQPLTITDDDEGEAVAPRAASTLTLVLAPEQISENGGESRVTAQLSGATNEDVTLTVSAAAVSPADSSDFALSVNRELTIAAGKTESTGTVTVTAVDNAVAHPNRQVTVTATVTAPSGLEAPAAKTLTITDDEPTPTVALVLAPEQVLENGGKSQVTAQLSGATNEDVTLTVSAAAVSPADSSDFALSVNRELTIAAGETDSTGAVTVTAVDNGVDHSDRQVTVTATVTGPAGLEAPAAETLTITDDEPTPTVALVLAPEQVLENGGESRVTAQLSGATNEDVTLTVSAAAVSPADSSDFALSVNRELTIAAGETDSAGTVVLTAVDNAVDHPNRQVTVTATVTGPSGLEAPAAETLTITDDEPTPTVTLVLAPEQVLENGGESRVTAQLSGATTEDLTLIVSASAVSPADSSDFVLSANRELTITAGETDSAGTVVLTAVDNAVDHPNRQVTVTATVTGPAGLEAPAARTLTITDDEGAPTVTLVLAPEQVLENGGESRVTAQLSGATTEGVTVTVSAAAVSPADSSDFALSANRELTIAAGETDSTGTVTVTAVDNAVDHPNQQVTVTATVTGPAGLEAPAAETLAITDDEPTPTVTLMLAPEEVLENGGESRVTAQLSGATSEDVTLTVLAAAVSPADSSDFALSPNRELTIAAGETDSTGTVTVSAVDNGVDHPNRQVTVTATVTGSAGLEAPDPRTLTIADDDERNRPPAFSQESYEFGLEEERDGRTTEVSLGSVQATDPEDEALTYALAGGDAGRFAVGSSNGAVSYIGPGEDAEAGLDDYALTVVARDPAGLEAEANVIVRIIPVNEMPSAVDDVAKTQEDEPVRVDVLANDSDPDGDRLHIVAVTAPLHGTTAVVPGGVRYAPAPDYHGPDAFSYTAADPGGLTATARVAVEVLPVNEPPEAEDDAAETQEDEPVVVDVLANDRDPDGDRLRVVDVTTPAHGSATMAAGGVRYVPTPDYHGADTFRYTVADPGGLTATATATLTVRPVNDAPEAVGAIPEQTLEEGGAPVTLDLTPYFTDVDGDVLTYAAESSDPGAATVTVAGTTLTLTAVVAGAARVTVTASDPAGLTATQVFGVAVGDRLVRAVLTDTLAALGRGHLSSVRQTVGRRLDIAGGETRRVMVAGQHFDPTAWHRLGPSGLMQTHALLTRAASLRQRIASMNLVGTPADPHLQPLDTTGAFSGFGLGLDQALQGTDVLLSFGGQPEEEAVGRQRRWTIWGQGDLQAFRGTPDTVRDYEGDLRTAYVGVDALAGRRWLFGAAVGRSGGRGTWQAGTTPGRLNTTLTTVYPYLRWGSGDTTVWAVAGAGRGTASLTRAAIDRDDASPLRLTLGLLEGRRRLATVGGGLRIGLRGEASAARLATGEGDDTIDALRAGVRRLRGGIEFTQELNGPRGMKLTPFGAVSARHDDGAGQTGVGLEVAGGMRLRGGRLQVEAQGRRLVLHSATGYSDHGLSLAASVGAGAYQPGLTLTVRPTWGTAGVGADTLWQDHFQLPSQGIGFDAAGIDAQIGYGLPLAGGKLLEPFGGYGQRAGHGRRLQFGARLGALDQIPGLFGGPVQLEFTGERYDRPGNPSDHRFSMVGVVNFGAPRAKRSAVPRATSESRTAWPLRAADAAPLPRPAPPAPRLLVDDPGAGESAAPAPVEDFLQEPVEPAVAAAFDGVPDPLPASPADVVNAQVEPMTTIDAAEAADPLPRLEPEPATLQEAAPRRAAAASNRTRPAARTDYQPSWPTDAVATDAGPEGDPLVGRVAPSTLLGYVTIIAGVLLWAIWRFLILARRERKRTPAARNPAAKMARASQRTRESAR